MQRGVGAHRMPDHMRLVDLERVHDRDDVVAEMVLAVSVRIVRDIGGRIAALAVADAAVRAREMAHLRLPGAVVAGIFMHEDDRRAAAGFLVIEPNAVARGDMRHRVPRSNPPIICTRLKAE